MSETDSPLAAARLPAGTRPGTVHLQVGDLDRSLRFYEELLGFHCTRLEPGRVSLRASGGGETLVELRERPGARRPPRPRLGLFHFAVLLSERAWLGALLARLTNLRAPVASSDHLVSEAIYLQDPDGLGVEIYADRPRASWRWSGGEVEMDTRPLDARSLLAEGAGRAWHEIPAGTTIGHVHLHVGDRDEASRFYGEALGLDVVVRGYPGALFLSAGGYHHHLGVNEWAGPAARPPADEEAKLLGWELRIPGGGADAAARRLEAADYAVTSADGGWSTRDPWGIRLLLRRDPE